MGFVTDTNQQFNYAGKAPIPEQPQSAPQPTYNGFQPTYQQADPVNSNMTRVAGMVRPLLQAYIAQGRLNPQAASKIADLLTRDANTVWPENLVRTFGRRVCSDQELNNWLNNTIQYYSNTLANAGMNIRGIPQNQGFMPQPPMYGNNIQGGSIGVFDRMGFGGQQGFAPQAEYAVQGFAPQQGYVTQGFVPQQSYNQMNTGYITQGFAPQPGYATQGFTPQQSAPARNASAELEADIRRMYGSQGQQTASETLSPFQRPSVTNPTYNSEPPTTTATPIKPENIARPQPAPQPAPRPVARPGDSWVPAPPAIDYSESDQLAKDLFGDSGTEPADDWITVARERINDKVRRLIGSMTIQHKPEDTMTPPAESKVVTADLEIDVPVESIAQAVADITANHKEATKTDSVYNIKAKMEHIIRLPFETAKNEYTAIQRLIDSEVDDASKTGIQGFKDVMKIGMDVLRKITYSTNTFYEGISSLVLDLFNHQFVISLGGMTVEGYTSPAPVKNISEMEWALNMESDFLKELKAKDEYKYCKAMYTSLMSSIFSIWSLKVKGYKGYLDPANQADAQLIVVNSTNGLSVDGAPIRLLGTVNVANEELKKKVDAAVRSIFVLTYNTTIVISNLKLETKPKVNGTNDFGIKLMDRHSSYAAPLAMTVSRHGYANVIIREDNSTIDTPYIGGLDTDGVFVMRKMQRCTRQNK